MPQLEVGEEFPFVTLALKGADVMLKDSLSKRPGILIGCLGAFEVKASTKVLPWFRDIADDVRTAFDIEFIGCVTVNDPYVVKAWAKRLKISNEITMVSDVNGLLTASLGAEMDASEEGFGNVVKRCRPFVMLIVDGKVGWIGFDQDTFGIDLIEAASRILNKKTPEKLIEKCNQRRQALSKSRSEIVQQEDQTLMKLKSRSMAGWEFTNEPFKLEIENAIPDSKPDRVTLRFVAGNMLDCGYIVTVANPICLKVSCGDQSTGTWGTTDVDLSPCTDRKTFRKRRRNASKVRLAQDSAGIPGDNRVALSPEEFEAVEEAIAESSEDGDGEDGKSEHGENDNGDTQDQDDQEPLLCTYEIAYLLIRTSFACSIENEEDKTDKLELQIVHHKSPTNDMSDPVIAAAPRVLVLSETLIAGGRDHLLASLLAPLQPAIAAECPKDNERISVRLHEEELSGKGLDLPHFIYDDKSYYHFKFPFISVEDDAVPEESLFFVACKPCFAGQAQISAVKELLTGFVNIPTKLDFQSNKVPQMEVEKARKNLADGQFWKVRAAVV